MNMPTYLLYTFFFLVTVLLVVILRFLVSPERSFYKHLEKRLATIKGEEKVLPGGSLLRTRDLLALSGLKAILKKFRILDSLQNLMNKADLRWRLEVFLLIMLIMGLIGGVAGFTQGGAVAGLAGGTLGLWLPYFILKKKGESRLKKFEKQLPDALDLIARGMRAGHSLTSGMQLVTEEMPDPIGGEFFKTFKEFNHGMELNLALRNLCRRVDLRDLSFFTTAVMIQRETGGNLTELLGVIATMIRDRFKLRNQIKGLTAEGRFSGIILAALPPLACVVLYLQSPDHIMLLVTTELGKTMTTAALIMLLLGILIIRKIVNIKI